MEAKGRMPESSVGGEDVAKPDTGISWCSGSVLRSEIGRINFNWMILVTNVIFVYTYMADLVEGGKYMPYLVQKAQDLLCPRD